MKKLFLMITLVAGFSAATYAHGDKKSPDQRAAHMTKALQRKLNLSAGQATQVNAIFFAQATQMDSLKNTVPATDRKSMHLAKRSIIQSTEEKLSSILNADQLQGYEAWRVARKEKMHEKRSRNAATTQSMQG